MTDIWIAVAVMLIVAASAGGMAARWPRSENGQAVKGLMALSIMGMVFFILYWAGQLFWAELIPSSAAIIYTNLAALLAALAAGWGWRLPKTPVWRRVIVSGGLGGASIVAILWPLLSIVMRPPPEGGNDWNGPVAMQSDWATCSPAAAATFLTLEGIEVSERDMIPLCLTDHDGTPTLGLYRGVKLKAAEHDRAVEIVSHDLETILGENRWPMLMAVRLPFGVDDPRFEQEWGWIPGMGHSVVALGLGPNGGLVVADPAVGLEVWTRSKLETLWQGAGMRLQ